MRLPLVELASGRSFGVKRSTLLLSLAAVTAGALAVALLVTNRGDDTPAFARPDVRLGSGTFAGRDWIYGYDVGVMPGPCFKLTIDRSAGGCGTYRSPVDLMLFWTVGGDTQGLLTAQGLVTEDVSRVGCEAGARPVGETHLFEMPQGGPRPVLCLVTRDELDGREWIAIASDEQGRPIADERLIP